MEKLVFELRDIRAEQPEDGPRKVVGRPAVYNELSSDLGGFRERILPGAFTKTLQESNYKSLWNHNSDYVLGSRKGENLTITEDDEGLRFEVEPPETQWAKDFMVSIDRGDVDQMSFMFRPIRDRWTKDEEGTIIRELLEAQLFEVSPVTFPAYPQTEVSLRDYYRDVEKRVVGSYVETANLIDEEWDATASEERWREHAGVESNDDLPNDTYTKRFAWHDAEDAENFEAYKLPHWDFRDGEEVVNVQAVRSALSYLPQTEGIPADDKQRIESMLQKYLDRWNDERSAPGPSAHPDDSNIHPDLEERERFWASVIQTNEE